MILITGDTRRSGSGCCARRWARLPAI